MSLADHLPAWLRRRFAPRAGRMPQAPTEADDWPRRRAPPRHRDLELSDKARRWLDRLPPEVRPGALAERFPRLANRFAVVWSDTGMTDYLLDDLLHDRRGGRRGFPAEVAAELKALGAHHEACAAERARQRSGSP